MVIQKRKGGWTEYAKHGAIHGTLALLAIGFANLTSLRTVSCFVVIFALTIVHLLIDRSTKTRPMRNRLVSVWAIHRSKYTVTCQSAFNTEFLRGLFVDAQKSLVVYTEIWTWFY
jgi:hypothetical protein